MGGACVIGSTLIQLPNGKRIPIQQLVDEKKEKEIVALDTNSFMLTNAKITDYVDSGIQDTITITTNSGKTICGTYHHPVLIRDKKTQYIHWEKLENITVGTNIGVPQKLEYFGNIHNKDARLLGMLIGDGNYSGKGVQYSSQDDELFDYINSNYNNCVSIITTMPTKDNKLFRTAYLKRMRQTVEDNGLWQQAHEHKTLPANYMDFDKESLRELIGGLYDTDGCFSISNNKPTIEYSSISPALYKGIVNILSKFGIHPRVKVRQPELHVIHGKPSITRTLYSLFIQGKENITNFYNNFHLLVKYKQDKLSMLYSVAETSTSHIGKGLTGTDLQFEKIVDVSFTGKQHVYDLTVDTHHNFIANDVIVHNTNAKMIKIGTPKTRNHFFESMEGKGSEEWFNVRRDWTQCPQLWALDAIMLPDHNDPTHTKLRPYSRYVFGLMPKSLKQWYFPTRPDVWSEGQMSVEDFKTQYMLEFVDGAGAFLTNEERGKLSDGDFDWLLHGKYGEQYVAGIDFAGSSAASADFTHITVLRIDETTNQKQKVYSEEMQGVSYPEQIRRIALLFGGYHPIFQCSSIFADFTGCGRPVVQTLIEEFGLTQLTGITFNASDTFTHSGMNLKNAMYANMKQEIDYDRFKYPNLDKFLASAGTDKNGFYHKMIGEWADLECEQKLSVNKRIEAPAGGHDDVPSADVLANFAATTGKRKTIAAPIIGHFYGGLK